MAEFHNITEPFTFACGLRQAGFDLRAQDLIFEPDKKPERVLIRFQTNRLGLRAMHALNGYMLNGKKVYAGGAPPQLQVLELDPRGPISEDQFPEKSHIQRCVTEAFQPKQIQPVESKSNVDLETERNEDANPSSDLGTPLPWSESDRD